MFPQDSSDSEPEHRPPKRIKKFVPPNSMAYNEQQSSRGPSGVACRSSSDELSDVDFDPEGLPSALTQTDTSQGPPRKSSISRSILTPKSLGFQMMQKMGYVENTTLGAGNNPNALAEPISVSKRPARGGIGTKKEAKLLLEKFSADRSDEYRHFSKSNMAVRGAKATIEKLQSFCLYASGEDLHLQESSYDDINVLWRDYARRLNQDEEIQSRTGVESLQLVQAQLSGLLSYSRANFFYCPYCGVQYDDAQGLASQCPGPAEALHPI